MGLIYKITNKINGKAYIGKTTQDLKKRMNKHYNSVDKDIFHTDFRKYGKENFEVEILEDSIADDLLDDKETYYIKKFNTCALYGGVGYNSTRGGKYDIIDLSENNKVLKKSDVKEIIDLLKNTNLTEEEISKKYNVSPYTISDINRGYSWKQDSISYPIREYKQTICTYEMFLEIIELLQKNLFSSNWIARRFNIATSVISNINMGIYKKYKYPEGTTFPIQKYKNVSETKISTRNRINLLIDKIENTSLTCGELSEKYNISKSYAKNLLNGNNKPHFFDDIEYPIALNVEKNLEKLKNKLKFLDKYKV